METFAEIAANAVLLLHAAYVACVVFGLPLIWLGTWRGWDWVRNWWFRGAHLAMIAIVVFEAWLGITCPLTTWENWLRDASGRTVEDGSVVFAFIHGLIFWDAPPETFVLAYTAFGVAIVLTAVLIPPRRKQTPSGTP